MIGDVSIFTATPNAVVAMVCKIVAFRNTANPLASPPTIKITGPMAAAIAPNTTIVVFAPSDSPFNLLAAFAKNSTNGTTATATISPIEMPSPSMADSRRFDAPNAVAPMMSAISFAAPPLFSNSFVSGEI